MIIKKKYSVLFVFAIILLQGCAGMINGETQLISISSNVNGATITYTPKDGQEIVLGETPFTGNVPRSKGGVLTLSKYGYNNASQVLDAKLSMVFFLNFFVPSGTFSSTTDLSKETAYEFSPGNLFVNMNEVSSKIDIQKDLAIKQFVMTNYLQLTNEIAQSEGDYLNTLLYSLLETPKEESNEMVIRIQEALDKSNGVVTFGISVSKLFEHKQI
jgi:hypothetical protein